MPWPAPVISATLADKLRMFGFIVGQWRYGYGAAGLLAYWLTGPRESRECAPCLLLWPVGRLASWPVGRSHLPLPPDPIRIAQLALQNFSLRVARQLGDELDRFRALVRGELLGREAHELIRHCRVTALQFA